jgi:hypothetical protein
MSDDARLERIEKKLDEVGQAIVALARMEERMITLFKRMDKLDQEQSQHSRRLQVVEGKAGNAEFAAYAKKKLMDGDNAKFLVKGF